jgi:hypothetical protein
MTAEIVFDVEIDDLIEFLKKENGVDLPANAEYISLKPKLVDDFLEIKVLFSSNGVHPKEWCGYEDIKKEWDKEVESCHK